MPNCMLRTTGVQQSQRYPSNTFEAMEDEDEAVRARAAAIIDQQCAIEQYLIGLTFSTRGSDSGELMINTPL